MTRILTTALLALFAIPATADDIDDLARDLEKILGRGSVQVVGTTSPGREGVVTRLSAGMLVDAMNRERAAHGLAPLRLDRRLSMAAEDRIDDMFKNSYFDHVAPDGTQPFVWAGRRGYNYRTMGENLAVGYRTSANLVEGWMGSEGHRKNILGSRFEEIGIAISAGSPSRQFAGPTVVALYGSR